MRALLRDRSYRRLLVGQTLSAFGDHAMFLALAVWVKALTGSNAKAGLAILPFVLPSLFGPALGVYVDRFPRRRVMVATDLAAAVCLLPLFAVHDASDIWLIYLASFLLGIATVVYDAARAGLLVSMVPGTTWEMRTVCCNRRTRRCGCWRRSRARHCSRSSAGRRSPRWTPSTFVVSALFLLGVAAPTIERTEENDFWSELRAGLRHIVHTTDVRRLTVATLFVTLAAGVMEVMIFALIDEGLHRPPEFLGVLSTAQGVGAVVGGVVVGTAIRRIGELPTIAWALIAAGVGVGLLAFAELWIVLVSWRVRRRRGVLLQRRVRDAGATPDRRRDAGPGDGRDRRRVHGALRSLARVRRPDRGRRRLPDGLPRGRRRVHRIALYLAVTIRGEKVTQPTPSTGRTRRRERDRSSSRGARALAAPPQRSPGRHPTP